MTGVGGGSAAGANVLGMIVPRAQLRVFSPLEAFPAAERDAWRAYVEAGGGLSRSQVRELEDFAAMTRLVNGRVLVTNADGDVALVRRSNNATLISPLQLDLRAAVALASFKRVVPASVFGAFVADRVDPGRFETLASSGRAPHVLDEPFAVPLHWFVAFDPDDRHVKRQPTGPTPQLYFLTTVASAEQRLNRALQVVEGTLEDGEDLLAQLADVAAWLDAFSPDALLELDGSGLVGSMSTDELEADDTCQQLWQAIESLAVGDYLSAAAIYGACRARWIHRRAKQHAS